MSEHLTPAPDSHETLPSGETEHLLAKNAEHTKNAERESAQAETEREAALHEATSEVNDLKAEDHRTNPLDSLKTEEDAPAATPTRPSRELLQVAAQRQIARIQRQLPTFDRALSKVIHQPVVRAVSETAGKTVSRPSGLLGGGLVALAGTSAYLYLARHIGFNYNYGVFLVLFVGGFIVGVALELMVHVMTASRRHSD